MKLQIADSTAKNWFLLVLFGLISRIAFMGVTGVWLDEAYSIYYSNQSLKWILEHSAAHINHPPTYFVIVKSWRALFGSSQLVLESLSVGASIIAIVIFYFLAEQMFSKLEALGLSVLFSLHPFWIYYSVEIRMYSIALTGIVGFLLFLFRTIERGSRFNWFLLSGFTLLALYAHNLTLVYVFPGVLILSWVAIQNDRLSEIIYFGTAVGLLYVPWFFTVLRQFLQVSSDFWLPPLAVTDFVRLFYAWGGYTIPHSTGIEFYVSTVVMVLVFLVPTILSIQGYGNLELTVLWSTVLFPLGLISIISLYGQSIFLLRGFLFGLPALLLIWCRGVKNFPKPIPKILSLVLIIFLTVNAYRLHRNPPHQYLGNLASITGSKSYAASTLVHTSKKTFFPFHEYYRVESKNYILGDQLRDFFPSDWQVSLDGLRKLSAGESLTFIIYPEEFPNWSQLLNKLKLSAEVKYRKITRQDRTFIIINLPMGLSNKN